jgi:putative ABC transport system permease protein
MLAETLKLSLKTIMRNALRSFLTVLGIVIGVAAVIVMVALGQGTTAQVTSDVAKLGSNLLMVRAGQGRGGPARAGADTKNFDKRDIAALATQVPGVRVVAPAASSQMTAVYGNQNHAMGITGTDNRFFDARNWPVVQGREFTDAELQSGAAVCILGSTTVRELFGQIDPLGATIRLKQIACKVIGVLETKGASGFGNDQDDVVVMPLKTVQRRIIGNPDVPLVSVAVADGYTTAGVTASIEALLRERRHVPPGERDDFRVFDTAQIANMLTSVTGVLTSLLAAVAGVSLLVGGIGIMNIMLVSVTERTREIGIRLAIGAEARQVLMQFLVEAVVLSLFGGVVGVLVGFSLSAVAAGFLHVPLVIDPKIVAIAFLFSAAVGVVFGYFPARRAARLDPIEALRHE